jgi:molybdopterin converting factor small subunit
MLADLVGGTRTVAVTADTLGTALTELTERHPELRVHLYDETGWLRRNVLCFVNETGARHPEARREPLHDGDTVTILQSVAGG